MRFWSRLTLKVQEIKSKKLKTLLWSYRSGILFGKCQLDAIIFIHIRYTAQHEGPS